MAGFRYASRLTVFFNANGTAPAAGGSLTFLTTGTSDLEPVYLDVDLNDAAENPLDLDADGRMSTDLFLDDTVVYRVVLKDSLGNVIQDEDPTSGSPVADALAAHNANVNSHPTNATTTNRGPVSELANDAEAVAMADTSRVLTPSNLAALTPLTTRAGLVERATTAEIEAGTDDVRYISPLGLQDIQATAAEIVTGTDTKHLLGVANFVANWSASGSPLELSGKFPGGYTVKVGKRDSTTDAAEVFTFATPFVTEVYGVFLQLIDGNNAKALNLEETALPTVTGFTIDRDSGFSGTFPFYFLAFGK